MSTFYAELDGGAVIAESKPFRERRRATDPSQAACERHAELLAALGKLGWSPAGKGGPEWYEATLQRPLESFELDETPPTAEPTPAPLEEPARPVEQPVRPLARLVPQAPVAPRAPREAASASPPTAAGRRSKRAWKRTAAAVTGVAVAAGVAGIALAGAGASGPRSAPASIPSPVAAAEHASPRTRRAKQAPVVTRPAARRPVAAPAVHVTIAAPSRASWLEVRRSSARGAVLFSGELSAGHRLRFKGTRLWARFGAAGNLSISVDGRPLVLQGTYEHLFVAK